MYKQIYKVKQFILLLDLKIKKLTTDLVDCRCRFMKKVNNHLQIQAKSLQNLKVFTKKGFVHLHKFAVKVHHTLERI